MQARSPRVAVSDHRVDGSRLTVLLANHPTRKPLSSYVGEDTPFEQQDLCGERPSGSPPQATVRALARWRQRDTCRWSA